MSATWEGYQVTLFIENDLVVGIRFDLDRSYDFLKELLIRSAKIQTKSLPEEMVDRPPMYIAKLLGNTVTISGYTGSIGMWTEDLRKRMHAPKKDPTEEAYKGANGYSGHWKICDAEKVGSGVIEVYIKHGSTERLLGKSSPLDSFDLDMVLINTENARSMKLVKDGKELGEISLAEFALPNEEGWYTQGAVYRTGDLYVLWHTSIIDFKNALGYRLVK